MALARIQSSAIVRRAVAAALGICPCGPGGAIRVVVLSAGAASPRVQPQGRVPRAHTRRAEEAVVAEFPQSRKGLRRPDDAATHEGRGDAPAPARRAQGPWLPGGSSR